MDPPADFSNWAGVHGEDVTWSTPMSEKNRRLDGSLICHDNSLFRPNLSPAQVLRQGAFGGGYYRDIDSSVTKQTHKKTWKELPSEWLDGVDVKSMVASKVYQKEINCYGVNCGVKESKDDTFGLRAWEASGWMDIQDPYGWFQWYCRYYRGRRTDDDARQLSRWSKCAGKTGRWKQNLVGKCLKAGKPFDDDTVSPVVRQTLHHWGYRLSYQDYETGAKRVAKTGASFIPRAELAHVMDAGGGGGSASAAAAATTSTAFDDEETSRVDHRQGRDDRDARAKKRRRKR